MDDLVKGNPLAGFIEEIGMKHQSGLERAVGTDDNELIEGYDFQLEHVCHDVNVLRGLFGSVQRIDHVDVFVDGRYATAHLVYEDNDRCVLEMDDSYRRWFKELVCVPSGLSEYWISA